MDQEKPYTQSVLSARRVLVNSCMQSPMSYRVLPCALQLLIAVWLWAPATAQTVNLLNSISGTRVPVFAAAPNTAAPLKANLWANVNKNFPTNSWWSNMAMDEGQFPVFAAPYMYIAAPAVGLSIGYPWPLDVKSAYVISQTNYPWTLAAVEGVSGRTLTPQGPLVLNVQWKGPTGGSLLVPLAQGSPYTTAIFTSLTPKLTTPAAILSPPAGQQTGSSFTLTLNNQQTWRLYFSTSVTITVAMNSITLSAPFTGALRLAYVPTDAAQGSLDGNSAIYPTASALTAQANGDFGQYTFTWTTACLTGCPGSGSGKLLMLALPHHMDSQVARTVEVAPGLVGAYQYMLGPFTGVLGNRWVFEEALPPATWSAPRAVPTAKAAAIRTALANEQNIQVTSTDNYFGTSQAAAMAQTSLIADELGETAIAAKLRTSLLNSLDKWLDTSTAKRLSYDSTLGGIVSTAGLSDPGADFGSGIYNDHHFHYGYFLYALAVVAKFRPEFAATHKAAIVSIARDIATADHNDPYFPRARHFSWFDGHSFASGVYNLDGGKSQESVSEAINAYYGVYLLGKALGVTEIEHTGHLLLALETRAAQTYWQMPADSTIYEPVYARNKMTGQVAATKVSYTTWFGPEIEHIHLINMIPFTPITPTFLSAEYVREEFPLLKKEAFERAVDPIDDRWRGYAYLAQAFIDPPAAWQSIQQLDFFDDGSSRTNSLFWIATRPAASANPPVY